VTRKLRIHKEDYVGTIGFDGHSQVVVNGKAPSDNPKDKFVGLNPGGSGGK